ncbi:MAG TPA: hypothetical protein VMD97_02040 [Candidatus Aquilonibacter sp.]|nr:hypothetical protein [Candidatus Aquilonibacter sp.]
MTPEFSCVDTDLWAWKDWWIAFAYGSFWLLTPLPREFGPFAYFDDAYRKVMELIS